MQQVIFMEECQSSLIILAEWGAGLKSAFKKGLTMQQGHGKAGYYRQEENWNN
jgi:hypothetical protein